MEPDPYRPFAVSNVLAMPDGEYQRVSRETRSVHRGVRLSVGANIDPITQIRAAALRAGAGAVVAGLSAGRVWGMKWVDASSDVEIIRPFTGQARRRGRVGVTRTELAPDDIVRIDGLTVTSPIRTAFDLGRRGLRAHALGHLDDLARATAFDVTELAEYARTHPKRRGIVQLRELIPYIEPRSESMRESWLRLAIMEAGLPRPQAQIEVFDEAENFVARLDGGYREFRIGVEYDGEEFHSSPEHRTHDAARDERLSQLGWRNFHFRRSTATQTVLKQLTSEMVARGYRP